MIYFIIFWLITWIIAWGLDFAYFQRAYPTLAKAKYNIELFNAILLSIVPVVNLAVIYFVLFASNYGYQGFLWF